MISNFGVKFRMVTSRLYSVLKVYLFFTRIQIPQMMVLLSLKNLFSKEFGMKLNFCLQHFLCRFRHFIVL